MPNTTYPNSYVYDTPYMENPERHGTWTIPTQDRMPHKFVRPKQNDGYSYPSDFYYQVPQIPPYVYWYPNPVECRDVCGTNVCDHFARRLNNYKMCQFCQNLKTPQCWDAKNQMCTPCPRSQALQTCENQYGCANPNGFPHARVAPIDPKYTGCKLCN
jgi:hypothetical protein